MSAKNQVLGRGLDQLLGRSSMSEKNIIAKKEQGLLNLRIDHVYPDPEQPRKFFDPHAIHELALSIKEQGLVQPIVVFKKEENHFTLVAGERRWRAFQELGKDRIPAIVVEAPLKPSKKTLLALVENIQRQNLNPIEEAKAFEALLVGNQWSQQELANQIGRDRSSISNTLRLLHLHPEAQKLLSQNKISLSIAKLLLQEKSQEKQKIWARKAYYEKWTVRDLESKLKDSLQPVKIGHHNPQPLWLKEACKSISQKWSLDVSLRKSSVVISFSDSEQLKEFMNHVAF